MRSARRALNAGDGGGGYAILILLAVFWATMFMAVC